MKEGDDQGDEQETDGSEERGMKYSGSNRLIYPGRLKGERSECRGRGNKDEMAG